MSTTDWPSAITPAAVQWQLQKAGTQFVSPFNGTTQAVDYVAERWQASISLPPTRSAGAVAALLNNLAGGVNRVNLWHHGSGGQPAGTLRGAPKLAAAAARGDATLSLSSCASITNIIPGGGFSIDGNSDGIADGWGGYAVGSVGSVSYDLLAAGIAIGPPQRVSSTAMATGDSAAIGVVSVIHACGSLAGSPVCLSAYIAGTAGAQGVVWVDWLSAGLGYISTTWSSQTLTAGVLRVQATGVAPAAAAFCRVYVWMNSLPAAGAASVRIDAVQLELGSVATAYAGPATLLAGDMIGCSGQLFQVAADCIANDAGAMTVPLVNRVRSTIATSTAVTWYRPTAQFIMPAMAGATMQVPGYTQGAALDLVEVY